jgi:hypothetical protein
VGRSDAPAGRRLLTQGIAEAVPCAGETSAGRPERAPVSPRSVLSLSSRPGVCRQAIGPTSLQHLASEPRLPPLRVTRCRSGMLARDGRLVGVRRVGDCDPSRGSRSLTLVVAGRDVGDSAAPSGARGDCAEIRRRGCGLLGAGRRWRQVDTRRLAMVFNRGRPTRSADRWVGHAGRPGRGVRAPRRSPVRRGGGMSR